MKRVLDVTRLHLNKPLVMFGVPLFTLGAVLVVTAIIALAMQRAGADVSAADYAEGARMNMGMVWSLPGFLVYLGVQAVSTTFPFALAMGTTRKNYVTGTALSNIIISAYVSLAMAVLLGIELLTDHWFVGIYALDVYLLGSGDFGILIPTAFIGVFTALSIGGVFGAIWARYGNKGPTILGIVLILVAAIAVLIAVPYFGDIVAFYTLPLLALTGIAIAVVAQTGTWLCMRRVSVR